MAVRTRDEWKASGVSIAREVDLARIAEDAEIHPGSRISGSETSIGPGSTVGSETPATIENCQLGRNVALKGGFFSGASFFDGANVGSGAHIRAGTILEEDAGGAHSVGLKQTVFLPFVTAGSLINFCDALMAGGTSRKDHSEIGSAYVHFNYTPHQDKATPSLVGDVPNGVFLDNRPVFLGGQGGLVGPARIAYGSVIAAGGVCRQDISDPNQLHVPDVPLPVTRPYETGVYRGVDRIVRNNLVYIGNIAALREWYRNVRGHFLRDRFDLAVLDGGVKNLDRILAERIRRLDDLADKLEHSIRLLQEQGTETGRIDVQQKFRSEWETIQTVLLRDKPGQDDDAMARFLEALPASKNYIETIQSLPSGVREDGCTWLQSIVNGIEQLWSQ
jgi:UDP-N-acetylglucosamine/UDP-N-acetylgalactosamine diphosphorylase